MFDLSTGECDPTRLPGTGVVQNPGAWPLGSGAVPAPAAAPISAELAKAQHAQALAQQQQQQFIAQQQRVAAQVQQQQQQFGTQAIPQQQKAIAAAVSAVAAAIPTAGGAAVPDVNKVAHHQIIDPQSMIANTIGIPADLLGGLHDWVKTRRYVASFDFSLYQAANDPASVKHLVAEQAHHIFRLRGLDPTGKGRGGVLSSGIVVGVRVLKTSSDCKVPLGVNFSGVRGMTYSLHGVRCAIPLFPHEQANYAEGHRGVVVHRMLESLDVRNLERYGHLTLEGVKKTILKLQGHDFSFVEVNSPVMVNS